MEYTDEEKKEVSSYWMNKFVKNCELCHGTGYFENKVCKCMIHANTAINLEYTGFGRGYLEKELEPGRTRTNIEKYFSKFPEYYQEGKGLVIFGRHNTGKTVAVTTLAKNVYMNMNPYANTNFDIRFYMYDDLVRLSYDDKAFLILERIIKKTKILVLDNIGNETGLKTQARSSVMLLENILRNREMAGKMVWLTTALSTSDISEVYSEQIANIMKRKNFTICSN